MNGDVERHLRARIAQLIAQRDSALAQLAQVRAERKAARRRVKALEDQLELWKGRARKRQTTDDLAERLLWRLDHQR